MGVKPFASGQAFESLRDSDFDSCSALGEVIDNSIQADAENIRINFDLRGRDTIDRVTFVDDGHGMSKDILQNCLRMGWSSRYNDRTGIGRFGVGMTLGAIHECRRVDVYSKVDGGEWSHTYLDLDEIADADYRDIDWEIPAPTKKAPDAEAGAIKNLPKDHGTVVIWSKYDRNRDKPAVLIEEFRSWLGRTFRYFIWNESLDGGKTPLRKNGLNIFLNGQEIKTIDPLYIRPEKSEFPDDPKSTEYDEMVWDWPISDPVLAESLGSDSAKIRVRLSILPEVWRDTKGMGGKADAKKRGIDLNEGFSFLRHGREVGYDWIPHFRFMSEEKDRFWGCEIHFEPILDRAFVVKNIKRGAVPTPELKKLIGEQIGPWIYRQRELISEHWNNKANAPKPGEKDPTGGGGHRRSEKIAEKAGVPAKVDPAIDPAKAQDEAAEFAGKGKSDEVALWKAKFQSQPFTIGEMGWPGSTFVDIHYMGGSDALFYNNRHKFFEVLSSIKSEIKKGENLETNSERLTVLIDMLLIAYAKSESTLNTTDGLTTADAIDHLKNNWGQFLKTYIATWQEEYDDGISS